MAYTTLQDVKAWLSLSPTQTSDDLLLTAIIDRATEFIESSLGRGILSQTSTVARNGLGGRSIWLPNYPITDVAALTVGDTPYSKAKGLSGQGYVWDDSFVYLRGGYFTRGVQNVLVTYTGGFETVPLDMQQACIELTVFKYKARSHIGVTSHTQDKIVTDAFITKEVPDEVACVINSYKRTMFIA